MVEIASTSNGLLIPRMTTLQRTAILTPANGLLVYDITVNCLFFYNSGTALWQSLCTPGLGAGTNDVSGTYPALTVVGLQTTPVAATLPTTGQVLQFNGTSWAPTNGTFWNLLGNAGTNPAINFVGTTDNNDLVFRANNIEHARFFATGLFHNMQTTLLNTIGSDGLGHNTNAGGGGTLTWRLNGGGYSGLFYNQSVAVGAGGLAVKILATGAGNTILDVSTGVQGIAGIPVLTAKGNGNVGVGTNAPGAKFDDVLTDNVTASPIARFSRVGTGSLGWLSFFSGATVGDYNFITANGDKSIIFTNDNNPTLAANTGLVIAPWANSNSGIKIMESGNVGINTTPNPSAVLDVVSTNAGFAMPRMTSAQRKAIVSPLAGLQVYDINLLGFYYYDGTKWDCANNPAGTVQYFANTTAPNGYLECNGAAVNRVTYAELFNAIGTTYGVGNGTTTFNLPDLRGEFIRSFDNGKGSDPGRVIGTFQSPSPIVHDDTPGVAAQDTDFSMDVTAASYSDSWPTAIVGSIPNAYWGRGNAASPVANWVVYSGPSAQGMISASRPRNVALMPCIKY